MNFILIERLGRKSSIKIIVFYFIAGIIYIFLSDKVLTSVVPDFSTFVFYSITKGFIFIAVSSVFIYLLLRKYFRQEITSREKVNKVKLNEIQTELDVNKKIKDDLLRYQANLNALIESDIQSFILLDKETNILLFNKSASLYINKLTGVKLSAGLNLKSIVPENISESFLKNFESALDNVPASIERKFTIDGKVIWVNFIYTPAFNQNNEIFGVIFTGINITDRMNILNELKKTVEVYEELIKATPDAIAITNEYGMIEYISPVALELLGVNDISEALGEPCFKWFDGNDKDKVRESIKEILGNKVQTKGNVYRMMRDDGTTFIAEFNSSPIINNEGNTTSFISTFRDITPRIESEEKLKQYSNELKELNASKDRFFSIVAHDLRNPLQGLLGFSSLLNDNFSDLTIDEVKEYIGYIFQSSKKMHSLTNNLLQWSRIKTGKIDYTPEKFNLNRAVKHSLDLLKPNSLKKEIEIVPEIDENLFVYADRKMFDSIFQNLVVNAVKFSFPRTKVEVFAEPENNFIRISVKDFGRGIKDENKEKLFSIDTHFTTIGTLDEEGTGLGLILCKEMVEKHGGKITFESVYKKGSVFSFTLPLSG